MSGPYSPASRRATPRGRNSANSQPLLSGVSSNDRLFEEWRAEVNARQDDLLDKSQRTALILERLNNRLDEHDRRITALETAPREALRETNAQRGLSLQALSVILFGVSLLLMVLSPHLALSLH